MTRQAPAVQPAAPTPATRTLLLTVENARRARESAKMLLPLFVNCSLVHAEATRGGGRRGLAEMRRCAPNDRAVKVREIIRQLKADGWFLVETRGSHRQYKHALKRGRVTVAGKPSDDLAPGTVNSILKQSGLREKR